MSSSLAFEAIGTRWTIDTAEQLDAELTDQIHAQIDEFDKAYSRFRSDSLVTQISQAAGTYQVPTTAYKLLHFYEKLYKITGGKVTPLIGQLVADAGYDASYSFEPKALQPSPHWETVLSYDANSITVTQPVLLDFGAAGKGYLVDIIGDLLASAGLKAYTINAGGDILHRGSELTVGLENPFNTTEAVGTVALGNQSICASSGAKRAWAGFTHIIDPQALESPNNIAASWVIAADTMTADGLATALFFTGSQTLSTMFSFSYAIINAEGAISYNKDFPLTLFTAE